MTKKKTPKPKSIRNSRCPLHPKFKLKRCPYGCGGSAAKLAKELASRC